MAVIRIEQLNELLDAGAPLLGLDLGAKTIGLALSDGALIVASPHTTIRRTKFTADAEALRRHVEQHGVGGLVIGLPVNMNGSEGPRCQSARQFALNLLEQLLAAGESVVGFGLDPPPAMACACNRASQWMPLTMPSWCNCVDTLCGCARCNRGRREADATTDAG